MPFEAAVQRLQEIVRDLGNGSQSLTDSLRLFEEGVALVSAAEAALAGIEARAKELMRDKSEAADVVGDPA